MVLGGAREQADKVQKLGSDAPCQLRAVVMQVEPFPIYAVPQERRPHARETGPENYYRSS